MILSALQVMTMTGTMGVATMTDRVTMTVVTMITDTTDMMIITQGEIITMKGMYKCVCPQ